MVPVREARVLPGLVGVEDRCRNLKFSTHHQDPSMEFTSNEKEGVHLHTLVDREQKRSSERG